MNLNHKIFKAEKNIYFLIWTLAVIHAVYCFGASSYKYFQNYQDHYEDFTKGWHFLSNKRDKADFEWEIIFYLLSNFYPWIYLYMFISELIRNFQSTTKVLQLWQISFTLFFIQFKLGYVSVCIALFQPILFYLTNAVFRSVLSTWVSTVLSLFAITYYKQQSTTEDFQKFSGLNDQGVYILTLSLFWLNLKCSSYYLEKQDATGILNFFSYCLYPPTMFSGPFIPYEDFHHIYMPMKYLPTKERVRKFIANFMRIIFWFLFGNLCLHYVYVNSTSFQPELVKTFSNWSLYGYGYAMGQYFHIKYIVLYGLSTNCASYENVRVPHLPRCIGRIHLYSDMWKYFDPGLYKYLVKHIYIPVIKMFDCKLIGSFLCFLFVYLWHGVENYILIWTILNYIGITLEYLCDLLNKKFLDDKHTQLQNLHWSLHRKLKCFLAAPLLAVSAVSNFYFFAGTEIGNIFFQRIVMETFINNIFLLLVLYCCCQVSMELQHVGANKM